MFKFNLKVFHKTIMLFFIISTCFIECAEFSASSKGDNELRTLPKKLTDKNKDINQRLFKHKGWLIIPMLLGGLLKVAASIPLLLAIATFIGTLSLVSSKLALLISAVLGLRSLLSMLAPAPAPPPEPKPDPSSFSHEDLIDLHHILAKHAEKHHYLSDHDVYKYHNVPDAHDVDYSNYVSYADPHPEHAHSHPEHAHSHRKYITVPRNILYYPENYYTPSPGDSRSIKGFPSKPIESSKNIAEAVQVAAVHASNNFEQSENAAVQKEYANPEDSVKFLSAAEMAVRANALLEKETAENPNRRVGVKITKTIVKQNG